MSYCFIQESASSLESPTAQEASPPRRLTCRPKSSVKTCSGVRRRGKEISLEQYRALTAATKADFLDALIAAAPAPSATAPGRCLCKPTLSSSAGLMPDHNGCVRQKISRSSKRPKTGTVAKSCVSLRSFFGSLHSICTAAKIRKACRLGRGLDFECGHRDPSLYRTRIVPLPDSKCSQGMISSSKYPRGSGAGPRPSIPHGLPLVGSVSRPRLRDPSHPSYSGFSLSMAEHPPSSGLGDLEKLAARLS